MLCHYGLGVCLSAQGKLADAADRLQIALDLKKNDVLTMSALAAVLQSIGGVDNIKRAKAMFQ